LDPKKPVKQVSSGHRVQRAPRFIGLLVDGVHLCRGFRIAVYGETLVYDPPVQPP